MLEPVEVGSVIECYTYDSTARLGMGGYVLRKAKVEVPMILIFRYKDMFLICPLEDYEGKSKKFSTESQCLTHFDEMIEEGLLEEVQT